MRSGGLFLLRSGDLILADRVMGCEEACGSFHSNNNFKLMCFEKGDRANRDRTILSSDLLTAAVPMLPAFPNIRQAFLADS